MKSTVETLSPTRVRLTVEVPFDELKPSVDGAYRRIGQQVTVPGFRRGKVPAMLIDQRVGRGTVLEEAVNDFLPRAYSKAVTDNEVRPLGQPAVDVTSFADGADLTFTAEVDVRPELTLPDFESLSVTVDDAAVTDDDVEDQLATLRARFASLRPVDRPAQRGDFASIDLDVTVDGERVDELSVQNQSYEVGDSGLMKELDERLVGMTAGEQISFTPTSMGPDVAAKASVTVHAINERELPALDADFAQLVSEFDTLDELRGALREELQPRVQMFQLLTARDGVLNALLDAVDVPLSDDLVAEAVEQHFSEDHGDDDHRAEFEATARRELARDLVLDAVAEAENTQVTQAELVEYLVQQSTRYGLSPDEFAKAMSDAGVGPRILADVRRAKALSTVLERATVHDASGNRVDLRGDAEQATGESDTEPAVEPAQTSDD